MNTSNNFIFTFNKNFNLPEIPQKRPFLNPYIFTLPKLHLFFFFLSSYQQVALQRLYLLVIIKNQIGLYKY